MSRSKHSNLYPGTVEKIYRTPRGIGSKIKPQPELPFRAPSLVPRELLEEHVAQQKYQESLQDGRFHEAVYRNPSVLIMPTGAGRRRGRSAKRTRSPQRSSSARSGAGSLGGPVNLPAGAGGATLGGGAPVMHYDHGSTVAFTRAVRERFRHRPGVYRRLVATLSDIQADHTDKLLIIQNIIELFDGHNDLIAQLNAFLPPGYSLEIQADAVVVKIYETAGETMELVETGHSRAWQEEGAVSPSRIATSPETIAYVRSVREIYRRRGRTYHAFTQLLQDFHGRQVDELDTIQRVVALFRKRPDLVLGFNKFLPRGYTIHMYDTSGYVIEYPKRKGDPDAGSDRFTILLDAKYVHQR